MSNVYLIRHGQAGLRGNYDQLSDTGKEQARLLGRHLSGERVVFDRFYSGELDRQRQTAQEIGIVAEQDARWNEFDLESVCRVIAPQIAERDESFRREWEAVQNEAIDVTSAIHRRWTACDVAIVRAWILGRYDCDGVETWQQFRERVTDVVRELAAADPMRHIGVATSATPIAICLGMMLELRDRDIMRLAGALFNSSLTVLRVRESELHLLQFNSIPHLADPRLRTFR
jgi:broad specificity phosphatase PhoE